MTRREHVQERTLREKMHDLASTGWVLVMLFVLGIAALITAVLVAWPAIAYIASRLLGS